MSHVIALIACHNRRDRTVACLRSLFAQEASGHELEAILVDDGSSDGTADAARAISDKVEVVRADGSLYWAGAMALAERHAKTREPDYVLWLNDDVVLYPSALVTLLEARDVSAERRIVVGAVVDPETGVPTYGGADRVDWHPMRFRLVAPDRGIPRSTTTFNGNVALVPRPVYLDVGGIDGSFAHAYADFDYGLRARALGIESVVARSAVGTCSRQPGPVWDEPALVSPPAIG